MAIRAVVSLAAPTPDTKVHELWFGGVSAPDGEEGSGVTTAAVLSFIANADPGTWYTLADFENFVANTDWNKKDEEESWTCLQFYENGLGGSAPFSVDVKLGDAIASLCISSVQFLKSLAIDHIWVRFE